MGMSSLLGILSGLGDILSSVFGSIFNWLIEKLVVPVIKAMITAIMLVVKYCLSAVFYEISKFLMGLIDFVEILFRALAGLSARPGADMSISMTLDGKDGDLLISMLTSHEVIQAFYATAIVGMFLLIITTIFQMIKVEYTTEGAQNSKTTILGKSLKSLCNMLIVPLLCILGVFIGNQVLDLIDTATGGGEGNKISGQLWITAATTAMIEPGSFQNYLNERDIDVDYDNSGALLGLGIEIGIWRGISFTVHNMFHPNDKKVDTPIGTLLEEANDTVENSFAKCADGYNYYNLEDVVRYYNPFEVNYLVLIFGACIIIKCLFYTCFGLIDRLYQCVALFIVMPMVIGMSPVKDSMGSWRSKFMSKALSAYGTVISLNLFFIIVKVMLNIDIKFNSTGSGASTAGLLKMFSTSFMEGLIKSIMVIVGCLMIEKLAGDLGGYFGGGNAMAEGKGLAKDATAGITKAATLAAGVATGGVGLVKAAGGIAGKVGKTGFNIANRVSHGKVGEKWNAAKDKIGGAVNNLAPVRGVKSVAGRLKKKVHAGRDWKNDVRAGNTGITDDQVSKARMQAEETVKAYEQAKEKNDVYANRNPKSKDKQQDKEKAAANLEAKEKEMKEAQAKLELLQNKQASEAEKRDKIKQLDSARIVRAKEGTRQLWQDKFGANAMFNTFAPKSLQNLRKDYQSAQKTAMDSSSEGQTMMAMLDKQKKDEAEATFNKRNAGAIETRNLYQAELILKTTNEKMAVTNAETNKELQTLNSKLEELINKKGNAADDATKSMYANQISAIQQSMQAKNSKISFGDDLKVENKEELKVDFKMDANFMKKIQDEIKKGVKMDDIMEQINEEFKKIGLTDKDTLAKIYKALEELKSNFGGK